MGRAHDCAPLRLTILISDSRLHFHRWYGLCVNYDGGCPVISTNNTRIKEQHRTQDQAASHQRGADSQPFAYEANGWAAHDLSERIDLTGHRNDRRPHRGLDMLVDPRRVDR